MSIVPPPEDDARVLSAISFARDGRYTATEQRGGKHITTTGRYDWNGLRLKLNPEEGAAQVYPCKWMLDGRLVLRYESSPATLKRTD